MQPGSYTLRIATPLEFKPYRRGSVRIDGTTKLEEIDLERISSTEALPATPEIESQLSGEELLWNLPGSLEEKEAFHTSCGYGCHSFQQILKNRYDERSWRVMVERMLHHGQSGSLLNPREENVSPEALAVDEVVIKWLARVRGPESKDGSLRVFPRLSGESNRVVVTEYELPRAFSGFHDVMGDSNGNIWYTSHFSRYVGRLDPHTGVVTEYQTAVTPGFLPGTHHAVIAKDGSVLISKQWSQKLLKLDPRTGQMTEVSWPGAGNFAQGPDGFLWITKRGSHAVQKFDPETGRVVQQYPIKIPDPYDSVISDDGNFWAGGGISGTSYKGNTAELLNIETGEMLDLDTGYSPSAGRRGGFDPSGNVWFGGENGALVEVDAKAKRIREFWPPAPYDPYTDLYSAMPDKDGEVWTHELHGRNFLRFNPRTGYWTQYAMPEPYAHARYIWVDNSTDPITVWYPDYSTDRVVRIQPLE
jgi:streptogramin lyase